MVFSFHFSKLRVPGGSLKDPGDVPLVSAGAPVLEPVLMGEDLGSQIFSSGTAVAVQ